MGIDLTILPFFDDSENCYFSQTVLRTDGDYELQRVILQEVRLHTQLVPAKFRSYLATDKANPDPHYGNHIRDAHDKVMHTLSADELARAIRPMEAKLSPVNRAVYVYLLNLPPATKCALYWH